MLKPDHPNYGLKSCGYCGKILEPGHTLRSSGTCSETCETKREKRRKDCGWLEDRRWQNEYQQGPDRRL